MHHSAQKSTSTGTSELSTSVSKFASVNSRTFALAIRIFSAVGCDRTRVARGRYSAIDNRGPAARVSTHEGLRPRLLERLELVLHLEHRDHREDEHYRPDPQQRQRNPVRPIHRRLLAQQKAPQ